MIERALDGEEAARAFLKAGGIWITPNAQTWVIVNSSTLAKAAFTGTLFDGDTWKHRFRRLKGATCLKNSKFGTSNRAIELPVDLLIDDEIDWMPDDEILRPEAVDSAPLH